MTQKHFEFLIENDKNFFLEEIGSHKDTAPAGLDN